MEFGQLVSYENQQARFKTFSTLKMIYTWYSMKGAKLLLSQWSTRSIQKGKTFNLECEQPVDFIVSKCYAQGTPRKKQHRCFFRGVPNVSRKNISRLSHMHFGQATTNQNKNPSISTLYIVKMLYGRCSTKEAISLLLHEAP